MKRITYALLALGFLCLFPPWLFQQPHAGLDQSWQLAMHLQFERGLEFGRDFVFTYGPLGIYFSRFAFPRAIPIILALDIVFFLALASVFLRLCQSTQRTGILFLGFLSAVLASNMPQEGDRAFVLLAIIVFSLNSLLRRPAALDFCVASLLTAILFFMKFHTGLLALGLLLLGIAILPSKASKKVLLIVLSVALVTAFSQLLHVSIPAYVFSSSLIASCYQDALALSTDLDLVQAVSIVLFLCCASFSLAHLFYARSRYAFFGALCVCLCGFLLLKQSLIRPDAAHETTFVVLMPLLFGASMFSERTALSHPTYSYAGSTLAVLQLGIGFCVLVSMHGFRSMYTSFPRVWSYAQALSSFNSREYSSALVSSLSRAGVYEAIPATATIDAIPGNILTPFRLGYTVVPRPIPASFQVCSPALDALNRRHYEDGAAANVIVLSERCNDEFYCFWSEPQTKEFLWSRFSEIGKGRRSLAIAKNETIRKKAFSEERSQSASFGVPFEVISKDSFRSDIHFEIKYSIIGRIYRLLYRAPALYVYFTLDDGSQKRFRATPAMLNTRLDTSLFVESNDDLAEYFSWRSDQNTLKGSRIVSIAVDSPEPWAFEEVFAVLQRLYTVQQ